MRYRHPWRAASGLAALLFLLATVAANANPHAQHLTPSPETADAASALEVEALEVEALEADPLPEGAVDPALEYFTDTVLTDQHGEPQRFYSDLLKDKVVVINAFFTSCTGVCPVMAGNLVRVQEWLGDRLGSDVHLISISVDPATDTPEKLLAYAERFGAREGWSFLAGDPAQVDFILGRLGQAVDSREDHTSVMAIGNLRTGLWKKAQGLAAAQDLIVVVDSVLRDEAAAHAGP